MKSASNYWIFLILTSLLFNCATQKPEPRVLPMQKAYVLLRTEGSEKEINELTNVLNSNFVTNKIASDINYYPLGRTWNINQIFTSAYNNNYDYIVLIDQVAKFTIDKKTNVGGKYQIRSYPIKSSNPDWVDLGQKTCNVTVRRSIDKFSQQIISEIVPNYVPSTVLYNEDELNAVIEKTRISEIDYNQLKSSEEIDIEIAELRKELEKEKERTNKAIAEREKLEKEYDKVLNFQKKKNESIVEGLESLKRKRELEEVKRQNEIKLAELKKKEAKAIAEAKELERKRLEDEQLAEAKRKEEIRIKELEKKAEEERLAEVKRLEEIKLTQKKKKEEKAISEAKELERKRLEEERLVEVKRQEENRIKELEKNAEDEQLAEVKRLEEIKLTEQKKKEERAIAEAKELERKQLEEERLVEVKRQEDIRIKEQEAAVLEKKELQKQKNSLALKDNSLKIDKKRISKKSSNKKGEVKNALIPTNKSNALIIIRGREEDHSSFKDLQDNLEFELLFANIKAATQILNKEKVFDKANVLNWNKPNYKYLILIDQMENNDKGIPYYNISIHSDKTKSDWENLNEKAYNLSERNSLKEFSKTVLKSL